MQNPARDILKFQSRVAANLLTMKFLVLGFVWIHYQWQAALLTFAVWMLAEKLLTESFYEGWSREIHEHIREHGCGDDDHDH